MKNDELLPLGTIVKLNDDSRVMVTGYYPLDESNTKYYTYLGIIYPIGIVDTSLQYAFDRSDIKEVIQSGYSNEQAEEYLDNLHTLVESRDVLALIKKILDNEDQS